MVRKKVIANIIGGVGILLGIVAGYTVVQAELYLNPMVHRDNYSGIVLYFYTFFALEAFPFLFCRQLILCKARKYFLVGAVILSILWICVFLDNKGFAFTALGLMACVSFPLFTIEFFWKFLKNRKTMPQNTV